MVVKCNPLMIYISDRLVVNANSVAGRKMSAITSENGLEDAHSKSFWVPGNYQRTVKRTEDSFQACNDIVACFQERARVERQYAQQLAEWSNKWKPLVETRRKMSAITSENGLEDAHSKSFWVPGNYQRTVKRTEDSFQACNDIVACFQERARVERQYAQQLAEWSNKWKPLVETSPLYGSLLQAWKCFLSSADRLASYHSSMCRSLVAEDGDRVRSWQKESFHKKFFGGFKESQDFGTGFARAQKPWAKRLKKLDKARSAYHKVSRREHLVREREAHAAGNPDVAIEKQKKIQEEREAAQQVADKVRARYEKVLEEVSRYAPRYMEEMECIFDQSQEEERKRISFLKEAFLSIHKHLDVTTNQSVKAVYSELHNTLMAIDDQEDLRWWKNTYGPGMPTDWPQFQEWKQEKKTKKEKVKKVVEQKAAIEKSTMIGGVKVRALYDYDGQETDELTFKSGEEFLKIEDEDDQGWCRGVLEGGREGLYPANYVEAV
ncbi:protein kinase C and casein kinase II substrate protein 3 isoform X3 [Gadus chalcogrammus]|uniref:protein kinase C and casein kinase II substrate protein 3 isoform X3 n=1 Tax=Gadus chalcogrammus TaxID=1042646 RepID=UPI0024C33722|nr:protein kinase C and casein kinase II substrate protein 3 isoform X3 [Gadus chalcogrammus]